MYWTDGNTNLCLTTNEMGVLNGSGKNNLQLKTFIQIYLKYIIEIHTYEVLFDKLLNIIILKEKYELV